MDVMEQSKKLVEHFAYTKNNIVNMKAALKGFNSYKNIGKELDCLQEFLFESQLVLESSTSIPLDSEYMVHVYKTLKVSESGFIFSHYTIILIYLNTDFQSIAIYTYLKHV